MIPLATLCLAIVALVAILAYLGRAGTRPLAERLVDAAYWLAIHTTAYAQSRDAGLCRYRAALRDIRDSHTTQYGRQAQQWAQEGE